MNYLNFNLQILVANDSNVTNWQERKLVCNCPFYLKNNLCKHNMALAAALKFVNQEAYRWKVNQKEDVVLTLLKRSINLFQFILLK